MKIYFTTCLFLFNFELYVFVYVCACALTLKGAEEGGEADISGLPSYASI